MPKIKTKKTLVKRVKISGSGKVIKKNIRTGHLKIKMDSSRKHRSQLMSQVAKGYTRIIKRLLGR